MVKLIVLLAGSLMFAGCEPPQPSVSRLDWRPVACIDAAAVTLDVTVDPDPFDPDDKPDDPNWPTEPEPDPEITTPERAEVTQPPAIVLADGTICRDGSCAVPLVNRTVVVPTWRPATPVVPQRAAHGTSGRWVRQGLFRRVWRPYRSAGGT